MERNWDVSRRKFLGVLGTTSFIRAGGPLRAGADAPSAPTLTRAYKVLQPAQVETLEAIAEQIVPSDQDPGARDAGAVHYIDNVLAGEQSEKLPLYDAGLEGVDQTSQLVHDRNFAQLSFDQQTDILKSLEQGTAQGEIWCSFSSQDFFAMVWGHILEGFYGPPADGGNKGFASWKMVGFPEHSGTM